MRCSLANISNESHPWGTQKHIQLFPRDFPVTVDFPLDCWPNDPLNIAVEKGEKGNHGNKSETEMFGSKTPSSPIFWAVLLSFHGMDSHNSQDDLSICMRIGIVIPSLVLVNSPQKFRSQLFPLRWGEKTVCIWQWQSGKRCQLVAPSGLCQIGVLENLSHLPVSLRQKTMPDENANIIQHWHRVINTPSSGSNHNWLVVLTPLKNISQWEGLSHILWKIKIMFETTNQTIFHWPEKFGRPSSMFRTEKQQSYWKFGHFGMIPRNLIMIPAFRSEVTIVYPYIHIYIHT